MISFSQWQVAALDLTQPTWMIALVSNMFYSWLQCVSLTYTLQTLMADWVSPKRWPSLACPSCSNAYSNQLHKQRQAYLHDPGMLPGSAGQCILGSVYLRSDLSAKQRRAFTKTKLLINMTGHCLSDSVNQDAKLIHAAGKVSVFQCQHSEFLNNCTNTWGRCIAKLIKHSLSC